MEAERMMMDAAGDVAQEFDDQLKICRTTATVG